MRRPNVLIIHTDQHRFDCLGAYGNADIRTPNVDALAADGVTYRNSFCPFPVCTPSRYSLITGLYVHQHLGWTNHSTIPSGLATFPGLLRAAGYRTQAVGKMHFTPTYLDVGFERMVLAEQHGPGRWDDDYHRYLRSKNLADHLDLMDQVMEFRKDAPEAYRRCFGAIESDLPEEHHSTTWIGDRAVEAIAGWGEAPGPNTAGPGDHGDQPNLLMAGFIKPHHPMDPPAPWSRMYDPEALTLLAGWTETPLDRDRAFNRGYFDYSTLTEPALRQAMAMYYASISQIDHHVGRMIDLLKEKGLYENTLIIFTSDHGDYMGFHHMLLKGNYMYDPLVKVPLIIKYPGASGGGGAVSEALLSNVDVTTTILSQAGCRPGEFMTGLDLATETAGREFIFAEGRRGHEYMVRTRTAKLLLSREPDRSQLFDLEDDPLEMENLFGRPDRREQVAELTGRISDWLMFDAPTPVNMDEDAPIISAPNARALSHGHRPEIQAYYAEKMKSAEQAVFGQ